MEKQRNPLSTKKPPVPLDEHRIIEDWLASRIMPGILALVTKIDSLIHDLIPDLHYAIKWGNAFYGTKELGWLIEVAGYDVSANIVFLSGAMFDPQPPLGTDEKTRNIKLKTLNDIQDLEIAGFIKQAGCFNGWK